MDNYFTQLEAASPKERLDQVNASHYADFQYFIKGDISGIQEFIFNVQSEGAAKTLKSRSFFIQILSRVCIEHFKDELKDQCKLFYDGGGTFYLFSKIDATETITKIQRIINGYCRTEEFYVVLNQVELKEGYATNFGQVWTEINQDSNQAKLIKFKGDVVDAFKCYESTFDAKSSEGNWQWKDFAGALVDKRYHPDKGIKPPQSLDSPIGSLVVRKRNIEIFEKLLSVENQAEDDDCFKGRIINKLPVWKDDAYQKYYHEILQENEARIDDEEDNKIRLDQIIDFHMMGLMAKQRTGTDKLGVLKLDIDNLGALFRDLEDIGDLQKTSMAMEWFFDRFLCHLWENGQFKYQEAYEANGNQQYKHIPEPYRDNVYVVFAGGDDCFVVGGWDAVFEFTANLHQSFEAFGKYIVSEIATLERNITLSASLTVVGSKFPVVRFAGMAEEALEAAKKQFKIDGKPSKNSISVFGHVLRWDDFYKAYKTSKSLQNLVTERDESRALLERLQQSTSAYSKLLNHAEEGNLRAPQVARLYYYLRNVKHKENLDLLEHQIIKPYSVGLLRAYQEAQNPNYQKDSTKPAQSWLTIPVAARWAELLTRKK